MGFHHLAVAARDMAATHAFYADVLGFELVKAVAAPTDKPGGWAKHLFYRTGSTDADTGMIAFWEIHDERMEGNDTAISTGLGFEPWVNHLAFAAADLDDIEFRKRQWLGAGVDVMEIDHGFCVSIYTMDPNGILVEFCTDTAPYTQADRDAALAILRSKDPEARTAAGADLPLGRRVRGSPGLTVIGWREWVALPDLAPDDAIKAKIDTGARTSAIHAWDIDQYDRSGERWVRFSLHPRQRDDDHVVAAEARLVEEREVRSSNGEVENRCVVTTTLALGGERWPIELTLTKRDQMGFRMLLGRTAMAGRLQVDPGSSYLRGGGKREPPR